MPSPTRRILIVVPNLLRDLEGHALVGYHLERCYGHELKYTTGRDLIDDLLGYTPDALVLDHLAWEHRIREAALAKRLGCQLVVLPTSGLFHDVLQHELIAGKAFEANKLVDCYLAWGDHARDALLESNLMTREQIRTVGSPRFDFYCAPYLSMMRDRASFLQGLGVRDPQAPMVVWTPANVAFAAVGPEALMHWGAGTNVDPSVFRDQMDDVLDQYSEHAPLVAELARRLPAWTVIVKVHPSDQLSRFLWMGERAGNIYVIQNAPIRELLDHCDVLLQRGSTTANEAWLLGKPVLSLATVREAVSMGPAYEAGNETVHTVDEVVERIEALVKGSQISERQKEARANFIATTYYRVDGRSSERCAGIIDQIVSPPLHTDAERDRVREAAQIAWREFKLHDGGGAANWLRSMIDMKPGRVLRFLRRAARLVSDREHRRGGASTEIRVENLYIQFARLHALGCRERGLRPSEDIPIWGELQAPRT